VTSEVWLTLTDNYFDFKSTEIVHDDCSELRLSLLDLGISAIRIQRHILGNVFVQRLQTFLLLSSFFYVFNFLKFLFDRFLYIYRFSNRHLRNMMSE